MKRLLLLAACFGLLLAASPQDPGKDLKSKDYETRKAAVSTIVSSPDKNAEKNLITALKDEDWEIVEMAAKGLGELGPDVVGKNGIKALTKMALEAPVRRLRQTAAEALSQIDPKEAAKAFTKKLGGKTSLPASEALIEIAGESEERKAPKALKKAVDKGKEYAVRVAAARAMLIAGSQDRASNLEYILKNEHVGVRCAALDVVLEGAVIEDLDKVE
ncbi:MAG: HEAT repeat domain-containing protein, partial [Planctomycetota bacterium]